MAIPLPPDPYEALGVEPTAPEGDIRKVYLKLVLKCHPDKIQDPTLRAQKTDEFHKIQEAWDLLSDKAKREDYDEKVKMNARANAMKGSAGQGRQMRGGGYAQPAPAGYNIYEFKETANANIYTAEPRHSGSRRKDPSPPIRVYAQPSTRTRSYEDELPSRYDDEPRMRKSASTDHSSRKSASAAMDRERRRADEDRERERYEKERKKKEYSSSQKSRDKEKRSRTEEKTRGKSSPFIVEDSPEEYEPWRSLKKDRGSESLMDDFDRMHISTSSYENNPKEDAAKQYISASRQKATRAVPIVPPAPQAVRHEDFRPQPVRRSETFSTYPMPQPSQPYYPNEEEVIRRSSARPSLRRPSADATSPRSSDPSSPRIVTAEPSFARKPTLQHHNSAPPIFEDRLPTRSQTMNDPPRRSSANTEPSMPPRSQTFNDKYSSPLKQSTRARYSSASSSSDTEDGPYVRSTRRPEPAKRPSVQKVYKVQSNAGKFQAVVEEESPRQAPVFMRKRSSSPRRSSERPHMSSRTTSSARPKTSSSSSRVYYDDQPSASSRREVPGSTRTGGGSYFGDIPVKYAEYGDVQYSSKYDGRAASNVPQYTYYTRREAVN